MATPCWEERNVWNSQGWKWDFSECILVYSFNCNHENYFHDQITYKVIIYTWKQTKTSYYVNNHTDRIITSRDINQ